MEKLFNNSAGKLIEKKYLPEIDLKDYFTIIPLRDEIYRRIYGKSYKENCTVSRDVLQYIRVLHYDFNADIRIGELISHQDISKDLLEIFYQLFIKKYELERMFLIDDYDADDEKSMSDNNTSCFNFRMIKGTNILSKHSYGYAIDINPFYNPYIRYLDGKEICTPAGSFKYSDRSHCFPHKIDKQDLCWRLFKEYGFEWGGDWTHAKDYQHFQKREKE